MTASALVAELMHANLLEVFNERDAARRNQTIDRIYAAHVQWSDDEGVTSGRNALGAKAEALQAQLGELQFVAAGPVRQTLGLGYLAWELVTPDGESSGMRGFDVAIIADDRIAHLYTVLTPA